MVDPIERDKAIQARSMTPAARFHMGFELFEMVRNRMLVGIRARSPELSKLDPQLSFETFTGSRLSPQASRLLRAVWF
jgi:hypothetical protein